jgi:hypothetical protein
MAALVAGADGSLIDPSDREAVIQAAEAVPGIEDVDINDGWLIENTRQLDAGPGMMKYSIILPDGLPFECTPFQIEHRRDMSKMWMGAVRSEIVSRANAAAEISRAAALKAKRDKQMAGAGIQVATAVPTREEAAAMAAAVKAPPPSPPESARAAIAALPATRVEAPLAAPTDPLEYAQQSYDSAKAEESHWADLSRKAAHKQKAAQKAALRWKTVIEAFSDNDPGTVDVAEVRKPSATRAEKLVHRLQT